MTFPGFTNPLVERIAAFLGEIGLEVRQGTVAGKTFLPGIDVKDGALIVDEARLAYPGDLLHEAGHFAVATPKRRLAMDGNVAASDAQTAASEEMMAIAWSYAAALHLGIEPEIVFHPDGYRGDSASLLENFAQGRYFGVPMLQYLGMACESKNAKARGVEPYPHMLCWVRATAPATG